jgi:hypothetical protein
MFNSTEPLICDAANLLRKRLLSWVYRELGFMAERQRHIMKPVYEANISDSNLMKVGFVTNSVAHRFLSH